MRILYLTDLHLSGKSPSSRLDVYYLTTFNKLAEIGEIINREKNIDIVIIGGDLFHSPTVSLNYAGQIAKIMKAWGKPILVVPGNHDIWGYEISTITQTMLGMFAQTGIVRLLTTTNPVKVKLGNRLLAIEGRESSNIIDDNPNNYEPIVPADFNIVINHGMLLDKPYLPDVKYTLTKDILSPANITIGGHYHPGLQEHFANGGHFFNPGSLLRVDATKGNQTFKPKVLIFDIFDDGSKIAYAYKYIELKSALPSNQIFDFAAMQQKKNTVNLLNQFKQFVSNTNGINSTMSINDMINKAVLDNNIDQSICNEALGYIGKSQINDANSLKNKGYIENPNRIHITKLVLHNFQSHKDTIIDLVDGLNIFIGQSGCGKTAQLRALNWVLYNEPKGADFIRTGENSCKVELHLSNGTVIVRERDRKSAGSYTVTDINGITKTYTGFGNDVPIEIFNAHQMPLVELSPNVTASLNMAQQLEGPFLLSLNASEKANAIGRIIGSQVLDNAIKETGKDIININRDVASLKKALAEKEKQLPLYDSLSTLEATINTAEFLLENSEKLEEEITALIELNNVYANNYTTEDSIKLELKNYDIIEPILNKIEQVKLFMEQLDLVSSYNESYNNASNNINDINIKLLAYDNVDKVVDNVDKLKDYVIELELLENIDKEYLKALTDENILQDKLNKLPVIDNEKLIKTNETIKTIEELKSLQDSYSNSLNDCIAVDNFYKRAVEKETKANEELEKTKQAYVEFYTRYLKDNNLCPYCNTPLDEHAIKHIIEMG